MNKKYRRIIPQEQTPKMQDMTKKEKLTEEKRQAAVELNRARWGDAKISRVLGVSYYKICSWLDSKMPKNES